MTNELDPLLQSYFEEPATQTQDDEFTEAVMAKTYARRKTLFGVCGIVALTLVAYSVFFGAPLQAFTITVAQLLSTSLIDFGESWVALVVSPLNSVAGLLAIAFKGVLMLQKKLRLVSI